MNQALVNLKSMSRSNLLQIPKVLPRTTVSENGHSNQDNSVSNSQQYQVTQRKMQGGNQLCVLQQSISYNNIALKRSFAYKVDYINLVYNTVVDNIETMMSNTTRLKLQINKEYVKK